MKWRELIARFMSPQTARFLLALLALGFSAYGANILIGQSGQEAGQAAIFAVGQLFALATMAFGYYFGSTARGDTEITNKRDDAKGETHDPLDTASGSDTSNS